MLHDPKTVIGSDFDQETAEKIAPQFIPRLELANCTFVNYLNISLRSSGAQLRKVRINVKNRQPDTPLKKSTIKRYSDTSL